MKSPVPVLVLLIFLSALPAWSAEENSMTTSALRNQGKFSFSEAIHYPVGLEPVAAWSGDLDNDGDIDLAISNMASDGVTILINNGKGNFSQRKDFFSGLGPFGITGGDFDRDGDNDLAVTNWGENNFVILKNDGLANFSSAKSYSVGPAPWSILACHLDKDDKLDLAVVNSGLPLAYDSGFVSVYKNVDKGKFVLRYKLLIQKKALQVAVGDVNSDHKPDLMGTSLFGKIVFLWKNKGGAVFDEPVSYDGGGGPNSLVLGDWDKDSDLDWAVTDEMGKKILVMFNKGDGEFSQIKEIPTRLDKLPFSIASGDFDLDGDLDLVYSYIDTALVCILENKGEGNFSFAGHFSVQVNPFHILSSDFDNDSDLDIVVVNHFSHTVSVLINQEINNFRR